MYLESVYVSWQESTSVQCVWKDIRHCRSKYTQSEARRLYTIHFRYFFYIFRFEKQFSENSLNYTSI